jgi:hypothetical protein
MSCSQADIVFHQNPRKSSLHSYPMLQVAAKPASRRGVLPNDAPLISGALAIGARSFIVLAFSLLPKHVITASHYPLSPNND